MNNPLISVIVPVYNVSQYLDECLTSIINQTYNNIEIICVNDGSIDNSEEICKKYAKRDSRIKIIAQENKGLSGARNTGILEASGEFITFIDSDDFIEENYVEYLYNLIDSFNTEIAISGHTIFYENGTKINKTYGTETTLNLKESFQEILIDKEIDVSAWAKLYKSNLFDGILFPEGKLFEDSATTYKLLSKCKTIAVGNKAIYNYRIRNNSITTSTTDINKKLDLITYTYEMCNFIKSQYPDLEIYCLKRTIWAYFSTLNQAVKANNKEIASNIRKEILIHKKIIIKNPVFTKRDKLGTISLTFGLPCYRLAWTLYSKIFKN